LIAIWPHFGWDGISDLHPMDDGSDELIVERLAAVVGIPTLRLSPAFREHFATLDGTTPRALYSVSSDAMHPTAAGAVVAARALEQRIADGLQLEPAADGEIDPLARALAQRKGDRPPERYKPYTNQGGVLGKLGRHREAIASYELALEHGPPPGWAGIIHYNIGLAAERNCDLERARQEYERAIELRPDKTYAEVRLRALPGRESACEESENAGPSSQEE
jgi:tetratricopeptide (TPR) repeat protein